MWHENKEEETERFFEEYKKDVGENIALLIIIEE